MTFDLSEKFLLKYGWGQETELWTDAVDFSEREFSEVKIRENRTSNEGSSEDLFVYLKSFSNTFCSQEKLLYAPDLYLRFQNKITGDELVKNAFTIDPKIVEEASCGFKLTPLTDDLTYLNSVARCIDDIRSGRFYQINLIRFFEHIMCGSNVSSFIRKIVGRLMLVKPAMGYVLWDGESLVASFSPERFVSMNYDLRSDAQIVKTFPIKGSKAPSNENSWEPTLKDQAELNIIVDLCRNDLQTVSRRGSVKVTDSGSMLNAGTIAHRFAVVEGVVDDTRCQTLHDLISAITPGASITGAPKREVLKAINECEAWERGYFMSNLFLMRNQKGRWSMDSNVNIRTLHYSEKAKKCYYAAGSGLTISSDPRSEFEEISLKCRVIDSFLEE